MPGVAPERARALELPDLRVLEAARHGNKLRVGHLDGNRFEMVLTGTADADGDGDGDGDGEHDREVAALSARFHGLFSTGIANRFGDQRFGAARDNAEVGLAILRGVRKERHHRRRRILLSAAQSAVFNRVLDLREASGGLRLVRLGDVLRKTATGGLFVSEDPALDQTRVDAGEVMPTGPLPGAREIEPPPGRRPGRSRIWRWPSSARVGRTSPAPGATSPVPGAR